jgi:uncharacterized protein (TIGR02001 family)
LQAESSASAGVDYSASGFYAGAWTADVEDGLEVDIYGGYGLETGSGVGVKLGFTSYQYTGEFDTEYNELNLGVSYGIVSLDVAAGVHEKEDGADDEDYTYAALTLAKNGFYGKYAAFTQDWSGDYIEVGYGTEISGFDAGVALIFSQDDLGADSAPIGDEDEAIVFSLKKSFDL